MGEIRGSVSSSLIWNYRVVPPILLFVFLLCSEPAGAYRDDWYGFVSFQDTSEWSAAYFYTCHYEIDLFREPRQFSHRNNLKPRAELQTPIRFLSKDAKKTNETITLHIYNNPGIRKAHSVSYGFQRNKECLHGQDAECVVFPETGRVRALVLNAERFTEKENLNYVKDHFLIEKPERFATILNAGSIFERKFYEAIFLGGYPNHPARTSHQIDGKTYPLEIYMYFLDETVPSVSLSTILVVLVEETDRDNPHIKPIINAVETKLYNEERSFLNKNSEMIRQERLFHHLKASVLYDVYDRQEKEDKNDEIIHEPVGAAVTHEALFTRFVEIFEKMQALEAELFFLLEDYHRVQQAYDVNNQFVKDVETRRGNELFPANHTEMQMLSVLAIYRGYVLSRDEAAINASPELATCDTVTQHFIRNKAFWVIDPFDKHYYPDQLPKDDHLDAFIKLVNEVCEYFNQEFSTLHNHNINDTIMPLISNEEKYELIRDIQTDRVKRDKFNLLAYEHFNDPQFHANPPNPGDVVPNYKDEMQKHHLVDGIYEVILRRQKTQNYEKVRDKTRDAINDVVHRVGYESQEAMREVLKYLKYGSKQKDLKYFRSIVHDEFVHRRLPGQETKRSLVELGGMEEKEDDIIQYENRDPVKAIVNEAFQISWLIPPDGGYYFYQGSSPVPPCFRAQNVIVFKRPIKMSKRQIDILTKVPTSFDTAEDVRFTTPHIHDTKFEVELSGSDTSKSRLAEVQVDVYDQPRNHLFLGHDGVHKNAVDEWDKVKEKKRNGAAVFSRCGGMGMILVVILYKNFLLIVE